MGTELTDQVIAEYGAGRPVEEIQAEYGLTRDEIEHLVADNTEPLSGWSLRRRGNQITLAVVVAAVAVLAISALRNGGPGSPTPDPSGDAKRVCQEEFIPERLKAPATAEYSGVTVSAAGELYTVTGSVDAQNSFGALIRSQFVCVVRDAGSNWVLQSASVG